MLATEPPSRINPAGLSSSVRAAVAIDRAAKATMPSITTMTSSGASTNRATRRRHGEPQMSDGRFTKRVDRLDRRLESVQQRSQLRQQPFAGVGRRNAPRCAIQQTDAEVVFERAYSLAQRCSGEPEPARRLCEACLLGDSHEGIQFGKSGSPHDQLHKPGKSGAP